MSRSWKQERTTPKTTPKKAPRPRVSDFARLSYQDKGYQVETPEENCDVCAYCDSNPCEGTMLGCKHDVYAT